MKTKVIISLVSTLLVWISVINCFSSPPPDQVCTNEGKILTDAFDCRIYYVCNSDCMPIQHECDGHETIYHSWGYVIVYHCFNKAALECTNDRSKCGCDDWY